MYTAKNVNDTLFSSLELIIESDSNNWNMPCSECKKYRFYNNTEFYSLDAILKEIKKDINKLFKKYNNVTIDINGIEKNTYKTYGLKRYILKNYYSCIEYRDMKTDNLHSHTFTSDTIEKPFEEKIKLFNSIIKDMKERINNYNLADF